MKLFFNAIFVCLLSIELSAQSDILYSVKVSDDSIINQSNWQQKVDFLIDVRLNTQLHTIEGTMEMTYINNSPEELYELFIHVWPNAYKNVRTRFAQQQIRNGEVDFEFYTEQQRGNIGQLEFTAKNNKLKWRYLPGQIDIIDLELSQVLKPGESITISTPFVVKLPDLVSRSGVEGTFYAVTQWYPKPAVFDVNHWHPISYLDQGEFYSEFGDYDVRITVPDTMTVAATGNMTEFKDTAGYKTYRFTETNIHDFAWFASSRFVNVKRQILLSDSTKVMLEVYGNKLDYIKSAQGLKDLESAIQSYSKLVGKYPYKTCKLVVGNLKAGEGMEYPTITLCKDLSTETIIHEVGHNWFYGILASNERRYPWMDESINSYFDKRVTNQVDSFQCKEIQADSRFYSKLSFKRWISQHASLLGYKAIAAQNLTQALNIESEAYTSFNYGAILYGKGPMAFAYLNQELGDSVFLKCFQNYYNDWKFRHPLPGDIQRSFETTCGRDLTWFFEDVLGDNNCIDVNEKKGKYKVKGARSMDSLVQTKPTVHPNPYGFLMEKNFYNNGQKKGLLDIRFPFGLPSYNKQLHVNIIPFAGYNIYDGLYPVLIVNNSILNQRSFEYTIVPGYSFKENRLNGYGKLLHKTRLKGKFDMMELGLQSQLYGLETGSRDNRYYRVQPFVKLRFKNPNMTMQARKQFMQLSFTHTGLEKDHYLYELDTLGNLGEQHFSKDYFFNYTRFQYGFDNGHALKRKAINVYAEYAQNNKFGVGNTQYLKAWLNAVYKYQYKKNKYLRTELFAGGFIFSKGQFSTQRFFSSGELGLTDYSYSQVLLGRSQKFYENTIFDRQIMHQGFRNLTILQPTDKWQFLSKNEFDFPGVLPLTFYVDLGMFKNNYVIPSSSSNFPNQTIYIPVTNIEFIYTGGVQFNMFRRTLEVFIPVFSSSQLNKNVNFLNTIGFKLNLNQLNPVQMISNASVYGKTGVGSQP